MKILVTGQCTLHWGRMEYGNIGNYYVIEPFFRELHRVFPGAEIRTTLQMSDRFCKQERVTTVPMETYYGWRCNELVLAQDELLLSEVIKDDQSHQRSTPYIDLVMWSDLVVDFSGDIWGDNANFLGDDRFLIGLIKDRIAQNLGKPTAMLAGSPGPFSDPDTLEFAKEVYAGFDLVANREPLSTQKLQELGFDTSRTIDSACPAFLFEPGPADSIEDILFEAGLLAEQRTKPLVGFIICGWNFERAPFDIWPREDNEYNAFVTCIEAITVGLGVNVCLMSHSNGFDLPPSPFSLKHGRDYPIMKQLHQILLDRGLSDQVTCLDGVYEAWQTKAIIGNFDMLVSGRVHAAVAGLSQSVPTVIIDYGHAPKAHKLRGFAAVSGVSDFIVDPTNTSQLTETVKTCWLERHAIRQHLDFHIPRVIDLSRSSFNCLRELFR